MEDDTISSFDKINSMLRPHASYFMNVNLTQGNCPKCGCVIYYEGDSTEELCIKCSWDGKPLLGMTIDKTKEFMQEFSGDWRILEKYCTSENPHRKITIKIKGSNEIPDLLSKILHEKTKESKCSICGRLVYIPEKSRTPELCIKCSWDGKPLLGMTLENTIKFLEEYTDDLSIVAKYLI
jgi:hypothetical protein